MTPQFFRILAIDHAAIQQMRIYWNCKEPFRGEAGRLIAPRSLRFATYATLDGKEWHRRVAELLTGELGPDRAPCIRDGLDARCVRSVRKGEIDWTALEPREWSALRAMGLPHATALKLSLSDAGDSPDTVNAPRAPSGRLEVTRATLLPALHAALTEWGEDALRPQADALRSALRAEVLAVIDAEGLRGAARVLGVSVSTLQRWRSPGGCLAGTTETK